MKTKIEIVLNANFPAKINTDDAADGARAFSGSSRRFAEAAGLAVGAYALGLGWVLEAAAEAERKR